MIGRSLPINCPNLRHKFPVGERLRPDGIDDNVLTLLALFDGQTRQIINVNWLQTVLPVAKYPEHRQSSQSPGDVVDEDVLFPKKNRRAKDGVGNTGGDKGLLQNRLASEILKGRVFGWVRDADVDDPLDACLLGCLEKDERIADCISVLEEAMIEPRPSTCCKGRTRLVAAPPISPADRNGMEMP